MSTSYTQEAENMKKQVENFLTLLSGLETGAKRLKNDPKLTVLHALFG